jgi:uncharacterized sporulation protein YeaH/YhbH (DUF444 family)
VASTAFDKAQEIIKQRFDAGRYNIYLFYASDGANFPHDADNASAALNALGAVANFQGYIEVQSGSHTTERSEMGRIFDALASEGTSTGSYLLTDADTVWNAIRAFFTEQSARQSP